MNIHETINYLEFPSTDIEKTKLFFSTVFNWSFRQFGAEYISFIDESINGGFYLSDKSTTTKHGGALIVFYSQNLMQTKSKITAAGGVIIKPVFKFPGGRRFHFTDTTGNEFAVWSDM
ncbi:MAG: VOC family protein [Psychromonas sp.]|nr:VOC family protein [Psychromonas sp.]